MAQLRALLLAIRRQQYIPLWSFVTPKISNVLVEETVVCQYYDIVRRTKKVEDVSEVPQSILVVSDVTQDGQYEAWKRSAMRIHCVLVQVNLDIAATRPNAAVITEHDTAMLLLQERKKRRIWLLQRVARSCIIRLLTVPDLCAYFKPGLFLRTDFEKVRIDARERQTPPRRSVCLVSQRRDHLKWVQEGSFHVRA
jgi:hypothetical protein